MQIATRQVPSPAGPEAEPTARRHPAKRIAVWLVGLVAVGAISIGVASNDGRTRPVGPSYVSIQRTAQIIVPSAPPISRDGVNSFRVDF